MHIKLLPLLFVILLSRIPRARKIRIPGWRASGNLDDFQCRVTFCPQLPIFFVMQGKCLFYDILRSDTVKHLILVASKFVDSKRLAYWLSLIFFFSLMTFQVIFYIYRSYF